MKMILIDDCCYSMNIMCGGDLWAISGNVQNHPDYCPGKFIYTSAPTSYDIIEDTFTTKSGREYQIINYRGSKEKFVEQITKDIAKGGYEVH